MSRSRYSRFRAHLYALPLAHAVTPNHGSVACGACGRMTQALDALGSYVCTCGDALYVDPATPASATSAKR